MSVRDWVYFGVCVYILFETLRSATVKIKLILLCLFDALDLTESAKWKSYVKITNKKGCAKQKTKWRERKKKRISKWLENRIAIERTVAIGQIATFSLVLSFLSCSFVVWNVHFINNNKQCVCASHIEMKWKTTKIN